MRSEQPQELTDASAEVERLQARVDQLEDELFSLQAWANAVVADAQKRVYWLDRMHLDLDPIMRRVPFEYLLGVVRRLRHWRWRLAYSYYRARRPFEALLRLVRRPPS